MDESEKIDMLTLSAETAKSQLSEILREISLSRQPVEIASEKHRAVLIPSEDWNAVQETLYLLAIPGMRESIRTGMLTPISECEKE